MHYHVNEGEAWTNKVNFLERLRLVVGYRMGRFLGVFGGVALNVLVRRDLDDGSDFGLIPGKLLTERDSRTTVRMGPGVVLGLSI
jgi:hypothetical protein